MTRKSNVAWRESDDNINYKNVVIIWIRFTEELKYFY